MTRLPTSFVKQSFVMSHFSSTQQWISETSSTSQLRASHGIFGAVSGLMETYLAVRWRSQCNSGHWYTMRAVQPLLPSRGSARGLGCQSSAKLGSRVCQAVVRDVVLVFLPTVEIGITGGVEDGVDNSGVCKEKLRGCVQVLRNCRPSLRSPLLPLSATSTACAKFFWLIPRSLRPRGGP